MDRFLTALKTAQDLRLIHSPDLSADQCIEITPDGKDFLITHLSRNGR